MLPHFAQSLGGCSLTLLSCWEDAPSLCSVTGGMLPRFTQSLGGRSLASLSCWGDAPSLRSVTGRCFLASLSHWGDAPSLRSVAGGHSVTAGLNPLLGPSYSKVGSYPLIKEGQWSHKYAFLRASRATLLC